MNAENEHERADWLKQTDLAERLARYLHPEDFDDGHVFEWDAGTIEMVDAEVAEWRDRKIQQRVLGTRPPGLIDMCERVEAALVELHAAQEAVESQVGMPYEEFIRQARKMFAPAEPEPAFHRCGHRNAAFGYVCEKPRGHADAHAYTKDR